MPVSNMWPIGPLVLIRLNHLVLPGILLEIPSRDVQAQFDI